MRRASLRVPTMPASSTTTTVRSSRGGAPLDGGEERVEGGRGNPSSGFELCGGPSGQGGADDPVARTFPSVASGIDGEGLPRARRRGEDVDTVAGHAQVSHDMGLLARQRRMGVERPGEVLLVDHRDALLECRRWLPAAHAPRARGAPWSTSERRCRLMSGHGRQLLASTPWRPRRVARRRRDRRGTDLPALRSGRRLLPRAADRTKHAGPRGDRRSTTAP